MIETVRVIELNYELFGVCTVLFSIELFGVMLYCLYYSGPVVSKAFSLNGG